MEKKSPIEEYYNAMRIPVDYNKEDRELLKVIEERSRYGFVKNFGANLAADAVYDIATLGLKALFK